MAAASFFLILSGIFLIKIYLQTGEDWIVFSGIFYIVFVFIIVALLIAWLRYQLLLFSKTFCRLLDDMLNGEDVCFPVLEKEHLFDKMVYRLMRLYEVLSENRRSVAKEREDLQSLISDISHQVKTPIANLKMINATLLEQPVEEEKRIEFLKACGTQIDKLSLIHISEPTRR